MESFETIVIKHHFGTVVGIHTSAFILQEFLNVLIRCLRTHTLEAVHTGIAADTIHSGHPETALAIAKDIFNLIIGQPHRIVSTEVLMVFMSVVTVQTTEGAYP